MNIRKLYLSAILIFCGIVAMQAQNSTLNTTSLTEAQLYTNDSIIEVQLNGVAEFTGTTHPRDIDTMGFTLVDAPAGIYIVAVRTSSTTRANVTLRITKDYDTDFNNAYIIVRDSVITTAGDDTTDNYIAFTHYLESAALTSVPASLDERNIDGSSYVHIDLNGGERFVNFNTLSTSDFNLVNFPDGVSLTHVNQLPDFPRTDIDDAYVLIDYAAGDFDLSIINASVIINPGVLKYSTEALETGTISITAFSESVAISSSSNLDEQNLDNGVIVLGLTNDETTIKGGALDSVDFWWLNFPDGTRIDNIVSDGAGTEITIDLGFDNSYDFDTPSISNARIAVKQSILTWNKSDSLSTAEFGIAAYDESISASITPDLTLNEYNLDGRILTVEITDDWIKETSGFDRYDLDLTTTRSNLSIDNVVVKNSSEFDVYLKQTGFEDIDASENLYISIVNNNLNYSGDLDTETENITFKVENPSAFIAPDDSLKEYFLDTLSIVVQLTDDWLSDMDGFGVPGDLSLLGAPSGLEIEGVRVIDSSRFRVDFQFNPYVDFDADEQLSISILDSELYQKTSGDLISINDTTVYAKVEIPAATLTAPVALEEYLMHGKTIDVQLTEEWIKRTETLLVSDLALMGGSVGLEIASVATSADSSKFTITLKDDYNDFDDDLLMYLVINMDKLLQSTLSDLQSDLVTLRAKVEIPVSTITPDIPLQEYGLDGRVITLTMADDWIIDTNLFFTSDVSLIDAPAGLTINIISILDTNSISILLSNVITDFDADSNMSVAIEKSKLVQSISETPTHLVSNTTLVNHYFETPVSFSTPGDEFREYWLDTNTVFINFDEEKFLNHGSLDYNKFGLHHAPAGLTIDGLTQAADSSVRVRLAFDPLFDFDITYSDVRIAIPHDILLQTESDSLLSRPFTILPNLEPVINSVSIPNDTMMIGDIVTATFEIDFLSDSVFTLASGDIGGYPLFDLLKSDNDTYTAKFEVSENMSDFLADDDISVNNLRLDDNPLIGETYNTPISQDADLLDSHKPIVSSLVIIGDDDKQIGDNVILLISAFEEDLAAEDSTVINMENVTEDWVSFDQIGGGTYTLTYTIQPDDQNVADGMLESRIYLRDFAGNINDTCPKIAANNLTIDAGAPSIISMTNTSGKSSAIIGDTVELTIISDGTDYFLTEDSRVNGIKPENGLILDKTGTTYFVRYVVKEGDDAVLSAGALQSRITLQDPSGNISPTVTSFDNNDILVYPVKPSATLTGNDEICYNDTATLFVNLTGTGPWDITYSDANNSYMVSGIPGSPHTIRVSPLINMDYQMDSVTDGTGNYNNGAGTSLVIVNPLPVPVITNLDNVYAVTDVNEYELKGNPPLGVFSGPGVSNPESNVYIFKPAVSGLTGGSPHTIKYEYVDNEGCYGDTTQKVNIVEATVQDFWQTEDQWACYLDNKYKIWYQNTSETNGVFKVLAGEGTPGFIDSLFYEESWDPVSKTDTLIIHPSILNWGTSPFDEDHDYEIVYNYVNNDGVTVTPASKTLNIDFFETARITSDVGTSINQFCSAGNPGLITGNYEGSSASFYGPGIVDLGGAAFQFAPDLADTGANMVYYQYTATHGCIQKDSAIITVHQTPAPRLARIDSCLSSFGSDIRFINVSDTIGLGPIRWTWNFGDQATGPLNTEILETMGTVSHFYGSLGKYTVTLSAEVMATGCTEDLNSNKNFRNFEFGNTPSPSISWTTECDKGIAVPISTEAGTVDEISSYHWIIKDQSGATVIDAEGSGLSTLDFTYTRRDKYAIQVSLETITGCIESVSDIIHLRPYYTDIATNGPILEDFESAGEGWSSQAQVKDEHNSWKWEQSSSGQWPYSSLNTSKTWYTELTHKTEEQSWVVSPCYDFTGMRRPMVQMGYRSISDRNFDGAVLQYRIDNAPEWNNVGEIDDGSINWYNSFRIQDGPGGQGEGWTGPVEFVETSEWKKGLHELDPLIGRSTVQFRIAYSNKGESEVSGKGFAFDNFWIGERTRIVLIEHFTNSGINGIDEKDNQINNLVGRNFTDAIDLHYHARADGATDPMNTDNPAPASARSLFYGIRTAPYTFMDGGVNGAMIYDYKDEFLDTLDLYTRALTDPFFEIDLPDSIAEWTDIKVEVKALQDLVEGEYILFVVIAEEDVNGYQNVVRDMLPSTAGISMLKSWTAGETKSFDLSYDVSDYILKQENLFVVAFIQDANTRLVYQAASTNADLNKATQAVSSGPVQDFLAAKNLEMLVYPNPATNQAYLVFAEALSNEVEIQLFSHTGSLVRNALLPAGTEIQLLDVGGLDQGVYLIRAIQNGRIIGTQRLMIMN